MSDAMGSDLYSEQVLRRAEKMPLPQGRAFRLVLDFEQRTGACAFPKFNNRSMIAGQLYARVSGKERINNRLTGLCGPASFLIATLKRDPAAYVTYVIDLFEQGKGKLGKLEIAPNDTFRNQGGNGATAAADIIAMGSLRHATNVWCNYEIKEDGVFSSVAAGTSPGELKDWFNAAGFTDVSDSDVEYSTNLNSRATQRALINTANSYFSQGYYLCLTISQNVTGDAQTQAKSGSRDHVALLASAFTIDPQDNVSFSIYDEGRTQSIKISFENFQQNFFGFVRAKP